MNEREHRQHNPRKADREEGIISQYERYRYGGNQTDTTQYNDIGSQLSLEQLIAQEDDIDRSLRTSPEVEEEKIDEAVDLSTFLNKAGEIGLSSKVIGKSVQDLSDELSDLSNPSPESTAWWQSMLQNVPYLGGLVEPNSGRMLINLGDEGYVLLTGDIQSIEDYKIWMSNLAPSTALFWNFPLLVGIDPGVVREAEDIMIGSRSSDLSDFIDAARTGSVNINGLETEAVPLLSWMALQAGEQSTDVEENSSATESNLVFAAAMSDRTIFVDPYSGGTADRLVDGIRSIYELVKTAPVAEQRNLEEMLEDELLDIISEDNRWGITDNDLDRMVDDIRDLEQQLQQDIDSLLAQEANASQTT